MQPNLKLAAIGVLGLVLWGSSPNVCNAGATEDGKPERPQGDPLTPLAFLAGHCWEGEFENGHRDIQCYEWVYGRKFLRSDHQVIGTDPRYQGVTYYGWDAAKGRLRFHYFTSLGAVSEGHLEATEDGFRVPEEHVDGSGKVTRLETLFKQLDTYHYSAASRIWADEQWQPMHTATYRRMDAPDTPKVDASMTVDGQRYRLAWNAHTEAGWRVLLQPEGGHIVALPGAQGDEWIWNRSGDRLLMLSSQRQDGEPSGWRPVSASLDRQRSRISNELSSDSSYDCRGDMRQCALSRRDGQNQLIALLSTADSSDAVRWGDAGHNQASAQYSPDGHSLLFRSDRGGSWELWIADLDGSNPRQLTHDPGNDGVAAHHYGGEGPARFSPDGKQIAWTRRFPERGFDVWIMQADGSEARNLTADHGGDDSYPSFSPDGQWLAFSSSRDGNDEIYRMRLDGTGVERISYRPDHDLAPLWIVDGSSGLTAQP